MLGSPPTRGSLQLVFRAILWLVQLLQLFVDLQWTWVHFTLSDAGSAFDDREEGGHVTDGQGVEW